MSDDITTNSHLTRMQWLRKMYLEHLANGENESADYYHRLLDEEWARENPL